jgi:hypothetical protein
MSHNPLPRIGPRPGKYPTTLVQGLRRVIRDKNANAKQVLRACELLMLFDPQVPAEIRGNGPSPSRSNDLRKLLDKMGQQESK